MRKIINAGLSDSQVEEILDVLSHIGKPPDAPSLARALEIDPKRFAGFLQTPAAKQAMKKATDLSRKEYYQRLIDASTRTGAAVPPNEPLGCGSDSFYQNAGISIKEGKDVRRNSPTDDRKDSMAFFKRAGLEVDQAEFDAWDKLARKHD